MLTWPHEESDWAPLLAEVEPVFYRIALEIARRETVLINCASGDAARTVRSKLLEAGAAADNLVFAIVASNDTWARDHGAITVIESGQPRILDFKFNGWGNKFRADADNAITPSLISQGVFGAVASESFEMIFEGGSIDSDGSGTLLTTVSCLLHPQRNPGESRDSVEQKLCEILGAERVLWLEHGELEGDDTDGHIDMLARFVDAHTILYQSCDETDYSGYAELTAMEAELARLATLDGQPYRLVPLPWPQAKFDADGARLPASYANFLVINDAVLVPSYDDPADKAAAQQIQACFPDRLVVQIPCLTVIQQHGSLHCLTMQFPKGVEFHTPSAG